MSSRSPEHWSLTRSLAFLAATVAIMFATLLPSTVAASAASGAPIVLCSGDRIMVVHDADGTQRPDTPSPMDSLKCAACVLVALTAPPPPPAVHPAPPLRIVAVQPAHVSARPPARARRTGPRPPSTAPPTA